MLTGRATDAVNQFALDVYEHLQREQGNLFFSPLSIAAGLAMTYAGAAGQTADEMEEVLHLGAEPGVHGAFGELLTSLEARARFLPQLLAANAIWPQMGLPVNEAFLDTIETDYDGHVQALDYSSPSEAADFINEWIKDETNGKLRDVVQNLSPNTVMVLTNSIYFKGLWESPFDPRNTKPGFFTRSDGVTVGASMMRTQLSTAYTSIAGYDVVDLPFLGPVNDEFSMVLIVSPKNGPTGLSPELFAQVDAWLENTPAGDVDGLELALPKFKTQTSTHLNQLLIGLGMGSAFDSGAADFSAMTPAQIWVDRVFHKAVIEVNEQGTEAAAATQVSLVICFAKGTPVLTAQGEKKIDELKPGDLVLARDENNLEGDLQPKRVEKVFESQANILELHVGGQVVRTTATHPFFAYRRGWTPAGELQTSDRLSTASGEWQTVDKIVVTQMSEPVFNLRVADYHTYFVGSKRWGFALWAHNACIPEIVVDRPFHLLIRDNTTSTILFMGRVDDPTQLQNEVTPTVVEASADFDGNQAIDGADFLTWQRGFGMAPHATRSDGDSDDDGAVDGQDFGQWTATFGQTASTTSINQPAVVAYVSPASSLSAASELDLADAAMAWEQMQTDDSSAASAKPFAEQFESIPLPSASTRHEHDWPLPVHSDDASVRPVGDFDLESVGDSEAWPALIDELLANAFA